MSMVMEWQIHRQDLTERRRESVVRATDYRTRQELLQLLQQHRDWAGVSPHADQGGDDGKLANEFPDLGTILAAEIVDTDDPKGCPVMIKSVGGNG
jgi:hypothetical protein